MPNATSQNGTAEATDGLSFAQGVEDISGLLAGLDDEVLNPGGPQKVVKEAPAGNGEEAPDEQASEEDQLVIEDEEVPADEVADEPAEEQTAEVKGGQFVPMTGKVTLEDGTVLTVADLVRNNLYQRDYTHKTTQLAEERKAFESDRELVGKHAQAILKQREVLSGLMKKHLPQPPSAEMAQTDPFGYNIARAKYEEAMGEVNQLLETQQASEREFQEAQARELEEVKKAEAAKFFTAKPHLRDQAKFNQWFTDVGTIMMEDYGFTAEELSGATDSRWYFVMDDIRRLKTALKKKPEVRKAVEGKPQLLRGQARQAAPVNPQAKDRQQASERLRKTGSLSDFVNSLKGYEL